MINLLPPQQKELYRYAYRNTRLISWIVGFSFALIGLAMISTGGTIYLHQIASSYTAQITTAQADLSQQKLSDIQKQVKDMGDSIKLSVQVLSKEVLFSKLLTQLASVMPNNSILTDLTINKAQSAVTITALTTDYSVATQLQVNLSDPTNQIFSHADIVSVTCNSSSSTSSTTSHYPCTVTLEALFAKNNPFLLINDKGSKP